MRSSRLGVQRVRVLYENTAISVSIIPKNHCVRRYPTRVELGMIWIYLGSEQNDYNSGTNSMESEMEIEKGLKLPSGGSLG